MTTTIKWVCGFWVKVRLTPSRRGLQYKILPLSRGRGWRPKGKEWRSAGTVAQATRFAQGGSPYGFCTDYKPLTLGPDRSFLYGRDNEARKKAKFVLKSLGVWAAK